MNFKNSILSVVAGSLISFLLGYLFYGIIFHSDFDNNVLITKDILLSKPDLKTIFLGHIVMAVLVYYIFKKLKKENSYSQILLIGALVGGLTNLHIKLVMLGRTNLFTSIEVVQDTLIQSIMWSITAVVMYFIYKMDLKDSVN